MRIDQYNRHGNSNGIYYSPNFSGEGYLDMDTSINSFLDVTGLRYSEYYKSLGYLI